MWMGGGGFTLAQSLVTLIGQLKSAYPSAAWQNSPDTGTIGDAAHQSQGSASDHNAWLNNTVRALDVANSDPHGPDCEALFQMVNRMYAARDSRVYPNGYAIYRGRITDWDNPGGFHPQQGDQHLNHVHISVSQNPAGYNSTAPWPLTGQVAPDSANTHPLSTEDEMYTLYQVVPNTPCAGRIYAVRAGSLPIWLSMTWLNRLKRFGLLTNPAKPDGILQQEIDDLASCIKQGMVR